MGVADTIVVVTMAILARRMFNLRLPGMLLFSAKLLLVTGIVLALAGGAWEYVDSYISLDSFFERLLGLSLAAVFCGGGLLVGTRLVGMSEGSQLVSLVLSILRRNKSS
jgi:hypothetical protein